MIRPVLRRGFHVIASVSFLLLLASAAMWVRSHRAHDSIYFESDEHGYLVSSSLGRVRLLRRDVVYQTRGVQHASYPPIEMEGRDARGTRQFLGAAVGTSGFGGAPGRWINLPYWMPCAVAGVVPLGWLWHRRRIAGRVGRGLCRHCGYDLRATPEQCPECGAPAASSHPKIC
jgi:hypothetical protein